VIIAANMLGDRREAERLAGRVCRFALARAVTSDGTPAAALAVGA